MAPGDLIIFALYGENYSNILKVMPASGARARCRPPTEPSPPPIGKNVMKFSTKLKFRMSLMPLAPVPLECTKARNLNSHSGHGDVVDLRNECIQVSKA